MSKVTIEIQLRCVGEFFDWCKEAETDPTKDGYQRLLDFLTILKKRNLKASTLQLYVHAIKLWYSSLVKNKIIAHHPCPRFRITNVQKHLLPTILTGKELDELYFNFSFKSEPHQDIPKMLLGLLVWQRIGSGDAKKLLCESFNIEARTVSVPAGARSNHRLLPLREEQLASIQRHIESREAAGESRFIDPEKSHLYYECFINRLTQDYERVTDLLQLKASVVVHWLTVHNLREVQYKCGHRYASSTERYLINDIEALQRDIDTFHPLGGL